MGDLMDMPIILDNTGDILTLRLTPEDQARAQNGELSTTFGIGREIIHIHIGQSGVQIASACWELYCLEHGIRPDGNTYNQGSDDNSAEVFFMSMGSGKQVPRVVMVDTEPTPIDEIRRGAYRQLFRGEMMITGKEDSASCFARGYFGVGRELIDVTLDKLRIVAEECTALQGFVINRSFGGGTGSGFTALLLEGLNRDYGTKSKIEYAIYPSPKISPIIVEPYNAVLTTHACMNTEDVCFIFDNQALYDILAQQLDVPRPTYVNLNRLIAQVVAGMTVGMRFQGSGSVMLSEFKTNLVPYPRIHFPLVTYAPFTSAHKASHEDNSTAQLAQQCFNPNNQMVKVNPQDGSYMSVCFFFRGDSNPNDINTAINQLKANRSIRFVEWAPTGFKVGISEQPAYPVPGGDLAAVMRSVVMVANSSSIRTAWARICHKFSLLYSKRAFVHHFVGEGLEEGEFVTALENVKALQNDYKEMDSSV